ACPRSALSSADRAAEGCGWTELRVADLALDGEGGAEARAALGAAGADLSSALGAFGRQLALRFVEVALREPAGQAERNPISEGLSPLLPQPVGSLAHGRDARRARWSR